MASLHALDDHTLACSVGFHGRVERVECFLASQGQARARGILIFGHETFQVHWLPQGSALDCIGVGLTLIQRHEPQAQPGRDVEGR